MQDHLHFAAFDMMARTDRDELIRLLQDWSYAAARMTQGLEVSASGAIGGTPEAPPDDTGEALDLPASGLTVTIGFGPTLFERDGVDRFGIAAQRPPSWSACPRSSATPSIPRSHGDLCVQACADDPQVAVHAIRNLSRIAFGRARIRWSQMGFGRTSKTTATQQTPRNLMGFKDGTNNILVEDARPSTSTSGSRHDAPAWLAGGTYLVARKIEMLIEAWDRVRLSEQETIIGRNKGDGAPLSGGAEFTAPDFAKTDAAGAPVIARRRTSGSPTPSTTPASASSGAATTSSTATTSSAGSMPACSSSRSSARPTSSCGCSGRCPPTCSTNTSATSAPECGRCRPARWRARMSAQGCSAEAAGCHPFWRGSG